MTAPDSLIVDITDLLVERRSSDSCFNLELPCFQVREGERVALTGPSGSGKSTLLDSLAMLVRPSRLRSYRLRGRKGIWHEAADMLVRGRMAQSARLRATLIGYVPQIGGLLPALSVERNITFARDVSGGDRDVLALLDHLGLFGHRKKKPTNLSVGERQRVAIGRALVHSPILLLADEPTSALDPISADRVLNLLVAEARHRGAAVIIATHDAERAERHGFTCVALTVEEIAGRIFSRLVRAV